MDIDALKSEINTDIRQVDSTQALEAFRLKYLGRKGPLAQLTASIPGLPAAERSSFGQQINNLKNTILSLISEKAKELGASASRHQEKPAYDLAMPGISQELGRLHPITQLTREICSIFTRMGFCVVEGPEIENEYNNFTGLNIPLDHPSRDAFDTFYLKTGSRLAVSGSRENRKPKTENLLLRSHTSPVQIRVMQAQEPPLAVVVPGRVYRPDATDASHSFMFHQVEGFVVAQGIKFSDLKGVLEKFGRQIFGPQIKMRFRPHFFPFTEPSAEVDISCIICQGKGCSVCGRKGWLEILGSGMIHPNVFKHVGYDYKKYSGFAFGMGVERIAMLKYSINDIRLFFENDLRFLRQF